MTSVEDLSAAVASLTREVAAMHIEMKVGALPSAQYLQEVIDAQALLNNTRDQLLLAQGGNNYNLNQRL